MRRRPRSGGFQPPTVETISVEMTDPVKSKTAGPGRKSGVYRCPSFESQRDGIPILRVNELLTATLPGNAVALRL